MTMNDASVAEEKGGGGQSADLTSNAEPSAEDAYLNVPTPLQGDMYEVSSDNDSTGDDNSPEHAFNNARDDPTRKSSNSSRMGSLLYDFRLYLPKHRTLGNLIRWLVRGESSRTTAEQTDEDLLKNLKGLARCLIYLRQYLDTFGMPEEKGGPRDQYRVLGEIAKDLYAGGVPMWALEPVLQKVAEGLTGHSHVRWQLLPRKCFMYNPTVGTTSMYKMERGFNISSMDDIEPVVLRLSSFASNVEGVSNVPSRFPDPQEFNNAEHEETSRVSEMVQEDPKKLAQKILALSSKRQGLFYYVNSREYTKRKNELHGGNDSSDDDFWIVSDEERELFTRLACQEAMEMIAAIDDEAENIHFFKTTTAQMIFRGCASAGACAFWFNGRFPDMIVAGILAVLIAFIGSSPALSRHERVIFEVVASFVVGFSAGAVALTWPNDTCFNAMAIAGILDILQGFRVVYAVIEVLSKHTVSGTADLAEGILMTGLISYFLTVGQYVSASIFQDRNPIFRRCTNGLDARWFILLVPIAAFSWSGLFSPHANNLLSMTYHGCFGYTIVYVLSRYGVADNFTLFMAASLVSLSAGVISRFTGRQALGNTISGIYVLLPGAYLVTGISETNWGTSFFTEIILQAITIGIGGWSGSVLCSPTLLGATHALKLSQKAIPSLLRKHVNKKRFHDSDHDEKDDDGGGQPMETMLRF